MHYKSTERGQEEFKTTRLKKVAPLSYVNLEKRTLKV